VTPRRNFVAGGLAAVALAAVVGGTAVFAQSSPTATPTNRPNPQQRAQDFLNDFAGKLGKSPADVVAAFKAAEKDEIAKAVQAGRLTQAQADKINQRIDSSQGLPFGGGFFGRGGRGFGPPPGVKPGAQQRGPGQAGPFGGVAGFLGIQPQDLMQALRSGKTLAQVAQDHGKSRDDLKNFLTTQEKNRLAQAVQAGKLTQQQSDQRLQNFTSHLDQMIDHAGNQRGPGGPRGQRGAQPTATAHP